MTTTFFDLIRHGEPAGGHKYRGHRDDPLSEQGWQQMRSAIGKGEQWDHILTSPLLRCREFAHELAEQMNLPVTIAEGFKEICFGDWEGKTREQVEQEYGDHQANFWRDAENFPPPNAETVQAFHQRIGDAWLHWSKQMAGKKVLLVCHGGVIRMVLGHVLGLTPSNAMAGFQIPFACRSQVRLDQTEFGTLSCLVKHG